MYIIINSTNKPVELDNGVLIDPGQQLTIQIPTAIMRQREAEGALKINDATETAAELKADAEAFKLPE